MAEDSSESSSFSDYSTEESGDEEFEMFENTNDNNNNEKIVRHVLPPDLVYKMMVREVKKVLDVLPELPSNKTRSLLNDFKWDTEKLLEVLLEGNERSAKLLENSWKPVPFNLRCAFNCEICCETITNPANIKKLACNHRFCTECFTEFVTLKVQEEGGLIGNALKCPGFKCSFELEDEFVLGLLTDLTLKSKYKHIIANSYVQNHRFIKWCPNATCQSAVQLNACIINELKESVRCSCGFWFCFMCNAASHDPIPCSMLIEWAKVRKEDHEVQNWILRNTKPCPRCLVNIQKNGGCMHMTCRKCMYQFCWVCMGLWTSSHNCGQNENINPSADRVSFVRRFSLYNAKHETMKQAYQLDVTQYRHKMVKNAKMELEMQMIKADFIANAVEVLLECRRTLMHSYIFSYFMTTIDNQMFIFEENLQFLEQCTEELSGIVENEVTPENVNNMKGRIINSHELCVKRRRQLLDHILEGNENNWWQKFPISPLVLLGGAELVEM